jgi:hypothetical protein
MTIALEGYLFNEILSNRERNRINPKGRSYSGSDSARGDEVIQSGTAEFKEWPEGMRKAAREVLKFGAIFFPPTAPYALSVDVAEISANYAKSNYDDALSAGAGVTMGAVWEKVIGAFGATAGTGKIVGGLMSFFTDKLTSFDSWYPGQPRNAASTGKVD